MSEPRKRPHHAGDTARQRLFFPAANGILRDDSNFTSASDLLLANTASVIIYEETKIYLVTKY